MTRKITKTLMASLVAATLATGSFIAPAAAGGSVAINFTPQNADEEAALRMGLGIYALVNAAQNGGVINQNGMNNSAGLGQFGSGNLGIVHQEGNGHSGSLQQHGNNNAYGVFQFGENTDVDVSQYGNGGTGATVVIGW